MRKKFNSSSDAIAFGLQLRQARLNKSLTLVELGRAANVDHSQISRYERGQMNSIGKNLQKICIFLKINEDPQSYSVASTSLGRKLDELLRHVPVCEPAVTKLVEALEGLIQSAHEQFERSDR